MGDIQFSRGYVNEQAAQAGRFGQRAAAPSTQGPDGKPPHGTADAHSGGEFGFDDFLDIINPLQHIPIVSTLYRELTGDEISAPARIFGGTLFGGPTGFVSAVANTLFDEVAGEDVGASVLAFFGGEGEDEPQLAAPGSDLPANSLTGETFAAAPLGTAASHTKANPETASPGTENRTGPDAFVRAASEGAPEGQVIPAGLLPLTAPPASLPGMAPKAGRTPMTAPPVPAGPPQEAGSNDGVLTGQDALSALFNDLRGGAAPAPLPVPSQTGSSRESQPARQVSSSGGTSSQALNTPAGTERVSDPAVPDAALADQMLLALDKYQAMTRQRGLANPAPPKPGQPGQP